MRDKMKEIIQKIITLKVNGTEYDIKVGTGRDDMPESETLAHTLRDRLGLTGLKSDAIRVRVDAVPLLWTEKQLPPA